MNAILIREVSIQDEAEFLSAMNHSKTFHHPWVQPPCTKQAFLQHVKKYEDDKHYSFLVLHQQKIAGVINVSEIVRGFFQNAFLGFYAVQEFSRRGIMIEGLNLVIAKAFNEFNLHRLEANIQPKNRASIALVERCGFRLEGFSPNYLFVDNKWCDHNRYAITQEDLND